MFIAVPITGRLVLAGLNRQIPRIARFSLWVAAGFGIWSLPLLLLLIFGVYRPELLGAAGWIVVAGGTAAMLRSARLTLHAPKLILPDWLALVGVLLAATLTAAYPADPFTTGSDMGTYASHAVYMARHGRVDVPYPWPAESVASAGYRYFTDIGTFPYPQLYPSISMTQPALTVQFAHLFPAWLAQTYAVGGYEALVRLNAVLMICSLLVIYGLMRRVADVRIAALAILFLAFNPSTIWVARQTLTETLTQLLIWSGLLLLTAFLRRGTRNWGVWAGILLGLSAVVRLDGFLVAPFLVGGHALWRVVRQRGDDPRRPRWRWVYAGAAPAFLAALGYYAVFNQPYLLLHLSQVLQIGGLLVLSLLGLGLTQLAPAASLIRAALSRRAVVAGLLCVLGALAAYAYFVRPEIPPYAIYDVPGTVYDGSRTFRELAFQNLARYLTPGVVWAALIGWAVVFCAVCWKSRAAIYAPLLVLVVGVTAVYLWDQSHYPNHFFVVRRFVPVIIPGLMVFTAVAATFLLRRLSVPGRRLAVGLSTALLAVFTVWAGSPMYTVAERQGSFAGLAAFAQSVPMDGDVLTIDGTIDAASYWMPLFLAFDTPILSFDVNTAEARDEALRRIGAASQAQPVTLVTAQHELHLEGVPVREVIKASWLQRTMEQNVIPVPRRVIDQQVELRAIEASGPATIGAGP